MTATYRSSTVGYSTTQRVWNGAKGRVLCPEQSTVERERERERKRTTTKNKKRRGEGGGRGSVSEDRYFGHCACEECEDTTLQSSPTCYHVYVVIELDNEYAIIGFRVYLFCIFQTHLSDSSSV